MRSQFARSLVMLAAALVTLAACTSSSVGNQAGGSTARAWV